MHSITDFFKFTPYDNKISKSIVPNDVTPEDFFWDNMYVDFPTDKVNISEELVSAVKSNNTHIVLFIGTSGSGKTTFLHHMDFEQKKIKGDVYASDFFNLIENPSSTDDASILNTNINTSLCRILDRGTMNDFQTIIDEYVEKFTAGEYLWNTTFLKGPDYDYHREFDNLIGSSDNHFSKQSVLNFCRLIKSIPDKIALYIIAFTLKECVSLHKKSVFIFDNMDEISQENLLSFINDDINNAYSKAQSFFDTYCPDYCFRDNCTIIISIRKTSTSYNATQLIDRYGNVTKTFFFDHSCRASLPSIIEHRISLYLNQSEISALEKERVEKIHTLSKDDLRFFNELEQLCNFDSRKVLNAMGDVYGIQSDSHCFDYMEHPSLKAGVRGMFMFGIFYGRISEDISRFRAYVNADINNDGCNVFRMLFTLMANMAGLVSEQDSQELVILQRDSISLLDFTERIQKVYNCIEVRDIYDALFVSGNISHAIPAILSGDIINQFMMKNQYRANLTGLCEYIFKLYVSNKNHLSRINILVNPLCGAYAERVFIHYEYFNVLSLVDEKIIDARLKQPKQSLFLLYKKDDISNCLERVYKKTEEIIKKADDHFCRLCGKKKCLKGQNNWRENCMEAINNFANDRFLIKNTLYSSRVITSHIRYLDVYRHFQFISAFGKGEQFNKDIHLTIIEYIEKYIKLYESKAVRDDTIGKVMEEIKTNFDLAKNSSVFLPITKETTTVKNK